MSVPCDETYDAKILILCFPRRYGTGNHPSKSWEIEGGGSLWKNHLRWNDNKMATQQVVYKFTGTLELGLQLPLRPVADGPGDVLRDGGMEMFRVFGMSFPVDSRAFLKIRWFTTLLDLGLKDVDPKTLQQLSWVQWSTGFEGAGLLRRWPVSMAWSFTCFISRLHGPKKNSWQWLETCWKHIKISCKWLLRSGGGVIPKWSENFMTSCVAGLIPSAVCWSGKQNFASDHPMNPKWFTVKIWWPTTLNWL